MWESVEYAPDALPLLVKGVSSDGVYYERVLVKDENLWWLEDRTTYTLYRPTHFWKELHRVSSH